MPTQTRTRREEVARRRQLRSLRSSRGRRVTDERRCGLSACEEGAQCRGRRSVRGWDDTGRGAESPARSGQDDLSAGCDDEPRRVRLERLPGACGGQARKVGEERLCGRSANAGASEVPAPDPRAGLRQHHARGRASGASGEFRDARSGHALTIRRRCAIRSKTGSQQVTQPVRRRRGERRAGRQTGAGTGTVPGARAERPARAGPSDATCWSRPGWGAATAPELGRASSASER